MESDQRKIKFLTQPLFHFLLLASLFILFRLHHHCHWRKTKFILTIKTAMNLLSKNFLYLCTLLFLLSFTIKFRNADRRLLCIGTWRAITRFVPFSPLISLDRQSTSHSSFTFCCCWFLSFVCVWYKQNVSFFCALVGSLSCVKFCCLASRTIYYYYYYVIVCYIIIIRKTIVKIPRIYTMSPGKKNILNCYYHYYFHSLYGYVRVLFFVVLSNV